MKKTCAFLALAVLGLSLPAYAEGLMFEYLGADDIGGGLFRHNYQASHNDPLLSSTDVTDIHVNRDVTWTPGTVTIESPQGWEGYYDGMFYHWNITEGSGSAITYGGTQIGFAILVDTPQVSGSIVDFTDDPLVYDETSIIGSAMTQVPSPEPATLSLLILGGMTLLRRRR